MQLSEQLLSFLANHHVDVVIITTLARKDDQHRLQGVEIGIEDFAVVLLLFRAIFNSLVHAQGLFESIVEEVDVLHLVLLRAESLILYLVGDHCDFWG